VSHLNPPNRQLHVCNFGQLICDIRHACLTRLLGVKVEIYQLPTLPTSSFRTSSPTNGGPLAPSGSFYRSNRQLQVCNFGQLICDIRHACLTRLLGAKVEIYQLPTLPTSSFRTSSPTNGGPLAPSGSFYIRPPK
jgi:hypothetical protein